MRGPRVSGWNGDCADACGPEAPQEESPQRARYDQNRGQGIENGDGLLGDGLQQGEFLSWAAGTFGAAAEWKFENLSQSRDRDSIVKCK